MSRTHWIALLVIFCCLCQLSNAQPGDQEEPILLYRGQTDTLILKQNFEYICDLGIIPWLQVINPAADSVYNFDYYGYEDELYVDYFSVSLPDSIQDTPGFFTYYNVVYILNNDLHIVSYDTVIVDSSRHYSHFYFSFSDFSYGYLSAKNDSSLLLFEFPQLYDVEDYEPEDLLEYAYTPLPTAFQINYSSIRRARYSNVACYYDSLNLIVTKHWTSARDSIHVDNTPGIALLDHNLNFDSYDYSDYYRSTCYWFQQLSAIPQPSWSIQCQSLDDVQDTLLVLPYSNTPTRLWQWRNAEYDILSGLVWEQIDSAGNHQLGWIECDSTYKGYVDVDSVMDVCPVYLWCTHAFAWSSPVGDDSIEVWLQVVREYRLDVNESDPSVPSSHDIISCYPNPFNSTVTFTMQPSAQYDHLVIFDILGREVDRISVSLSGSTKAITWNASGFSAGTYFARLEGTGSRSQPVRLLHLK